MQAQYPITVQAIRSKGQKVRFYVYVPLPLAAAIGLEPGEEVQWTLLDRHTLQMQRQQSALLRATRAPGRRTAKRRPKPAPRR
jgi:hypothetical protein